MRWFENITGGYSSSAKVVNDTLVLSLPDASSPVVWRMELGEIKAAAFEVERQDDGLYMLVMKNPKGENRNIAPFDNKGKAVKALMTASRAMEQAQSAIQSSGTGSGEMVTAAHTGGAKGKSSLMAGIVGVAILGVLIFTLIQISPRSQAYQTANSSGGMTDIAGGSSGTARERAGVPVSADDFLRQQ